MAIEEKEGFVQEPPGKKRGNLIKIMIIVLVAVAVVAAGVLGGWYFYSKYTGTKKPALPPPKPLIGVMWPMTPFIVNVSDNQGERYLKIVMELEVPDQLTIAELEKLKPKLRDNLLDLLSARSFGELMDVGGKQRLREEIALRLNSFLVKGKIMRVYFTEFVIQ